jgi:hypothetical protein
MLSPLALLLQECVCTRITPLVFISTGKGDLLKQADEAVAEGRLPGEYTMD